MTLHIHRQIVYLLAQELTLCSNELKKPGTGMAHLGAIDGADNPILQLDQHRNQILQRCFAVVPGNRSHPNKLKASDKTKGIDHMHRRMKADSGTCELRALQSL